MKHKRKEVYVSGEYSPRLGMNTRKKYKVDVPQVSTQEEALKVFDGWEGILLTLNHYLESNATNTFRSAVRTLTVREAKKLARNYRPLSKLEREAQRRDRDARGKKLYDFIKSIEAGLVTPESVKKVLGE